MLRKVTQNDSDDFQQVSSYCPPKPVPPPQAPSPITTPRPPRGTFAAELPPASAPACPPMRLEKGKRFDGTCWAIYVPVNYGTPIPSGCLLSGAPFPTSGC